MRTDFVLDALEQALYARQPERDAGLVCHSDRGSQYVSIRYTERLAEAGIEPSVGSKGDSYDNALAETINGLYKAELIHRRAPWKTKESVEPRSNGWPGSTTIDCSNPSAISRRRRLRQTTTGNSPVRPPRWRSDLNQLASTNPGAIQVQKTEHRKASKRAKVKHPFRVIKRQFGLVKVRFRGLAKNTAQVVTLFALSNLWMARKQLMASVGAVRPKTA